MAEHEATSWKEMTGAVGITGATGLIGNALAGQLKDVGCEVVRFSRTPPEGASGWRVLDARPDLAGLGAVVNLAGESVAQRWTRRRWQRIRDSRVGLTRTLVNQIAGLPAGERPRVLVNASAVGFYQPAGDEVLGESSPAGQDPLARLCVEWEEEARKAEDLGVRVVVLRTGIVLGRGGEAWERLRRVFRWGLGGRLGSGRQWMPWIHLDDEVGAIRFVLESEGVQGAVNLSAPGPVTNREFIAMLAEAVGRPAWLPVPAWGLRLALGGFAESLLSSYRMVPRLLQESGYEFRHPTLEGALRDLLGATGDERG